MKIINKKLNKCLLLTLIFPLLTSFANKKDYLNPRNDPYYHRFEDGGTMPILDEGNFFNAESFEMKKGSLRLKSNKALNLYENDIYTFVFKFKDWDKLMQQTSKIETATFNIGFFTSQAMHDLVHIYLHHSEQELTPKEFFNINEQYFKTKMDEKTRTAFVQFQIFSNKNYHMRTTKLEIIFNTENLAGDLTHPMLYKGTIDDYKGYIPYMHAPSGLLINDDVGPYNNGDSIDVTLPYKKEQQVSSIDFLNTVKAYDLDDLAWKNVEIEYDEFTSNQRTLDKPLKLICRSIDSYNNVSRLTFNITIKDVEPPTINKKDNIIEFSYKETLTKEKLLEKFIFEDNYTNNLDIEIEGYDFSNTVNLIQTHNITIVAKDTSNNETRLATSFNFVDNIKPEIIGPSSLNVNVSNQLTKEEILNMFKATDQIDGNIIPDFEDDNYTSNSHIVGDYSITIFAEDKAKNRATHILKMHVTDTEGPIFYINETKITTFQGEKIDPKKLLTTLINQGLLKKQNYIDTKFVNGNFNDTNKVGFYETTLEATSETNNKEYVNLKIDVIKKSQKNSNAFQKFLESIITFIKNLFKNIF